jgi:TolB-like protein
MASHDHFGLKVKLPTGNVAARILPIQINELPPEDKSLLENELGGVLRAIEFIYKEPGVNRPLRSNEDRPNENLIKTFYRNQINKVANAIDEVIHSLKEKETIPAGQILSSALSNQSSGKVKSIDQQGSITSNKGLKKMVILALSLLLFIVGVFALSNLVNHDKKHHNLSELEKSIAVLPFVNDSPDKENEYLCNGMMEEILNQLQKIGDLKVKARTSVEKYRNTDKDIKVIGLDLGVSLIMEGSVRKEGNDLRITAQLIDAKTGDHL